MQRVIGDTLELAPSGSASSSEDQILKTNSETMRVLTEILQVADDAQMEGRTSAVDHNAIVEAAGTLRRIANQLSSIATGRILTQMPHLDPVTEFARERVFDASLGRGWISSAALNASALPPLGRPRRNTQPMSWRNRSTSSVHTWRREGSHEWNRGRSSSAARCSRNCSRCANLSFYSPS